MATGRPGTDAKLVALTDAAAALARASDAEAATGAILEATTAAVGADAGAVFLLDPAGASLGLSARVGLDERATTAFEREVADPAHPVAAAARDAIATFGRPLVGGAVGRAADLPLVVTRDGLDTTLGVLTFRWPADAAPDESDERVARAAADLIAAAVDRALLASLVAERSDWLERLATTDGLSGLANRRTAERILEMELARAGRQGSELSLVLFDVDGFDALNATHGHAVGDDVLRAVAAVIAEEVRLVDSVARFGPDEFVVIAPGPGGVIVARRVLAALAAGPRGEAPPFTTSAAVVRFPADGASGPELIAAAEEALTASKRHGPGSIQAAELPGA